MEYTLEFEENRHRKICCKINSEKYWDIYKEVYNNWENLLVQAQQGKNSIPIADQISVLYKVSYPVSSDIARSIAFQKHR